METPICCFHLGINHRSQLVKCSRSSPGGVSGDIPRGDLDTFGDFHSHGATMGYPKIDGFSSVKFYWNGWFGGTPMTMETSIFMWWKMNEHDDESSSSGVTCFRTKPQNLKLWFSHGGDVRWPLAKVTSELLDTAGSFQVFRTGALIWDDIIQRCFEGQEICICLKIGNPQIPPFWVNWDLQLASW